MYAKENLFKKQVETYISIKEQTSIVVEEKEKELEIMGV